MSSVSELILAASLPGCKNAIELWRNANAINPLYYWPGTDARLVPAFYANHCLHLDNPEFRIINGVYKSNWSKNAIELSAAANFLNSLTEASIDYRIIKGGAICLEIGKLGARRMGDLDFVFHDSNRKTVKSCLLRSGFLPRYPGDRRSRNNEIWESQDGVVFDIHFINRFHFLNIAFDSLITKRFANHDFRIPGYDSMAIIAIDHGNKGHSSGDLSQAIWDCSMLSKNIDWNALVARGIRFGNYPQIINMIDTLSKYGEINSDLFYKSSVKVNHSYRIYGALKEVAYKLSELTFPVIINRNVLFEEGALKLKYFLNEPLYQMWLVLGSLAPLERLAQRYFGGLLRPSRLRDMTKISIDLGEGPKVLKNEYFAFFSSFSNEIRIKLAVPDSRNKLLIELELEALTSRMIFVNGVGHGHITPKLGNRYEVFVDGTMKFIEISFRDFSKFPNRWRGRVDLTWEKLAV